MKQFLIDHHRSSIPKSITNRFQLSQIRRNNGIFIGIWCIRGIGNCINCIVSIWKCSTTTSACYIFGVDCMEFFISNCVYHSTRCDIGKVHNIGYDEKNHFIHENNYFTFSRLCIVNAYTSMMKLNNLSAETHQTQQMIVKNHGEWFRIMCFQICGVSFIGHHNF